MDSSGLRERFNGYMAGLWVLITAMGCLTNWYNAFFLVMLLGWIVVGESFEGKWNPGKWIRLSACTAAVGLILLPFALPYLALPHAGTVRPNVVFSTDTAGYVVPPLNTFLGQVLGTENRWIWGERTTFAGYTVLALALLALVRLRRSRLIWIYGSLALVSCFFSLGPQSSPEGGFLLPLGYLYKLFPPLMQLRATARFAILVMFALSVLAGLVVARFGRSRLWAVMLTALMLFEYSPVNLPVSPGDPFAPRKVDLWLAKRNPPPTGLPGFRRPKQRQRPVVLELPGYIGTDQWYRESRYMVYSTQHWMNLVNGSTRFFPPGYLADFAIYGSFPAPESIEFMRKREIDYLVVHLDEMPRDRIPALESHPLLVRCFERSCIYSLDPVPDADSTP